MVLARTVGCELGLMLIQLSSLHLRRSTRRMWFRAASLRLRCGKLLGDEEINGVAEFGAGYELHPRLSVGTIVHRQHDHFAHIKLAWVLSCTGSSKILSG